MTRSSACVSILAASIFLTAAPVATAAPPSSMFKSGYNKCKLASLVAISKTAGETFAKASFDGKTCTWSSKDGDYVVLVDTHPSGYLLVVPAIGKHAGGEVVNAVA